MGIVGLLVYFGHRDFPSTRVAASGGRDALSREDGVSRQRGRDLHRSHCNNLVTAIRLGRLKMLMGLIRVKHSPTVDFKCFQLPWEYATLCNHR
jgi:hypothetical protein